MRPYEGDLPPVRRPDRRDVARRVARQLRSPLVGVHDVEVEGARWADRRSRRRPCARRATRPGKRRSAWPSAAAGRFRRRSSRRVIQRPSRKLWKAIFDDQRRGQGCARCRTRRRFDGDDERRRVEDDTPATTDVAHRTAQHVVPVGRAGVAGRMRSRLLRSTSVMSELPPVECGGRVRRIEGRGDGPAMDAERLADRRVAEVGVAGGKRQLLLLRQACDSHAQLGIPLRWPFRGWLVVLNHGKTPAQIQPAALSTMRHTQASSGPPPRKEPPAPLSQTPMYRVQCSLRVPCTLAATSCEHRSGCGTALELVQARSVSSFTLRCAG